MPPSAGRRRSRWARRAAACLSLALGAACAASPGSQPTPVEPGVLFRDDFSQPTSGWDAYTGVDVITNYAEGRYLIAVEQVGVDVWARPGLNFTDLILETDTQYAAGPVNNEYGVMCRYERGSDGRASFYFFFISSDGYYALGKVVKNARTILSPAEGSFQPSDAIRLAPDAINRLRATCAGNQFSLAVNDTPVGEFTDDELTRGDVGLIAGTFDEGGVRIQFDNLVVRAAD